MNDYQDLMNEYQDVKDKINQEALNILNAVMRIKTFLTGIDTFNSNILMFPEQKPKAYENIDKSIVSFSKNLMKLKNTTDKEIVLPLNNLLESANEICKQNLDKFNEIKISLIQERQKLNKTKDDYFKFVSISNQKNINEDENILYNAKKENYYQLYKYEVNQMNTIIDDNNIKYEKMYNDLWRWKEIQKIKIKNFFVKFSTYIEKIGNLMIEHSKNILNDINGEKEFDNAPLDDNNTKVKKQRFEKVKLEEYVEKRENDNKIIMNNLTKSQTTTMKPKFEKSGKEINKGFLDFDIIEIDEFDEIDKKSDTSKKNGKNKKDIKNNSSKNINSIKNILDKDKEENNKIIESSIEPAPSSGFDEFEIVEQNSLLFQKKFQSQNEKIIKDVINKIISEEELSSSEISNLMNVLKEENPSTKKLYSFTFLTELSKLNDKYIVILKNKKNFIHLSNILNDISIKESKIGILKLIIDISQIITYKEWYLYNLLQKKNKYLSTKSFWSKIILDSFLNDLNSHAKIIMNDINSSNNENNKNKEKETNIFLLEFIHFSNQIRNYKKLSQEQKRKLDKFARDNLNNILSKAIEGMCSFLVPKETAIEVINEFGKNFGFNSQNKKYFELLIDVYMNRNYLINLKKLSLEDKENKNNQNHAKICIISNISKFLSKEDLLNLIILKKDMSEEIKKKIFGNFLLNDKISIDERTKIWGFMLNVAELRKKYKYEEKKKKLLILMENNAIPKESKTFQNFGIIELDVNRTFFLNMNNIKTYQKILKNILVTLIYINKDIGYFQGMNYITAFFLQLFDFDEEKTFYFMLGIEKNTKFKELFENNLYKLTSFFGVFEKILKTNIPEIYHHQINNEINPNCYLPPWFLTLFTFMCTKFEKEKVPKFILLVLESFFLNGWSAIFNAGYTIIKYLRNDIIKLKAEVLMDFMVNSFGKKEILKEENFEIIKKQYIKNSYQINEELILKLLKITEYEKKLVEIK